MQNAARTHTDFALIQTCTYIEVPDDDVQFIKIELLKRKKDLEEREKEGHQMKSILAPFQRKLDAIISEREWLAMDSAYEASTMRSIDYHNMVPIRNLKNKIAQIKYELQYDKKSDEFAELKISYYKLICFINNITQMTPLPYISLVITGSYDLECKVNAQMTICQDALEKFEKIKTQSAKQDYIAESLIYAQILIDNIRDIDGTPEQMKISQDIQQNK